MKPMLAAAALAAALAMPALADPDPADWDAVTAEAQMSGRSMPLGTRVGVVGGTAAGPLWGPHAFMSERRTTQRIRRPLTGRVLP